MLLWFRDAMDGHMDNIELAALQQFMQRIFDQQIAFATETRANFEGMRSDFARDVEKLGLRIDSLAARFERLELRMTRNAEVTDGLLLRLQDLTQRLAEIEG